MPKKTDDKEFNWQAGETLDEKSYDAVPEVRAAGLPKVKSAVAADPAKRKLERDQIILNSQSNSYQKPKSKTDDGSVVIEETHSGLHGDVEDSKAKKLIDAGGKFRGFDRFGSKKDKP